MWSFGEDFGARAVSRRQFIRGYTHVIKDPTARHELNKTIHSLLGATFDAFDAASGGSGAGLMTRAQFVDYQGCWNLTEDEAIDLFNCVAGKSTEHITKAQYLLSAWDFYFGMDERAAGAGHKFWGRMRSTRPNLTF